MRSPINIDIDFEFVMKAIVGHHLQAVPQTTLA